MRPQSLRQLGYVPGAQVVRTGRDLGDAKSREGGDTRRGSETSGPAAREWLSPGLPGLPRLHLLFLVHIVIQTL